MPTRDPVKKKAQRARYEARHPGRRTALFGGRQATPGSGSGSGSRGVAATPMRPRRPRPYATPATPAFRSVPATPASPASPGPWWEKPLTKFARASLDASLRSPPSPPRAPHDPEDDFVIPEPPAQAPPPASEGWELVDPATIWEEIPASEIWEQIEVIDEP